MKTCLYRVFCKKKKIQELEGVNLTKQGLEITKSP